MAGKYDESIDMKSEDEDTSKSYLSDSSDHECLNFAPQTVQTMTQSRPATARSFQFNNNIVEGID